MAQDLKDLEEFKIFKMLSGIGSVHSSQFCTNKNCTKFQQEMVLKLRSRGKNADNKHLTWRCNGHKCGTYRSIWEGSFFSLFRKPIKLLIALVKCWSAQLTITKTCSIVEMNFGENLSENMVAGLFEKLRQICSRDRKNILLGGYGKIVEIDESLYAKVKHWKGSN